MSTAANEAALDPARPRLARDGLFALLIVGAVLSGSLALPVAVRPAAACSCMPAEVSWFVENTEAGFIGTLEGSEHVPNSGEERATVVNRFTVEGWIHGDLDHAEMDVWAPQGGGACGLEIPIGQSAAVFIDRRGDLWTSSLCATLPAEVARAALNPEPLPGGEASFAVPGLFPGGGMALLDSEGRLLGYDSDFEFQQAPRVARCPEGRRVLIIDDDRAMLIDLADLSVVKTVDLEGLQQVSWIRSADCADPDGQSIHVLVEGDQGTDIRRLEKVARPGRTIDDGSRSGLMVMAGDHIVGQSYLDPGERLEVVDPDGERRIVAKLLRENPDSYIGYSELKARPSDGAVVAVLESHFGDESAFSRLWLLDPISGERLVSRDLPSDAGYLHWLGDDSLVISIAVGAKHWAEILDATTLDTVARIDDFAGNDPVLVGETLLATDQSSVIRGTFDHPAASVGDLPARSVGPVLALTQPIVVEPVEAQGSGLRPVTTERQAEPELSAATESGQGSSGPLAGRGSIAAIAMAAALLAAAIGFIALTIAGRRPGSREPRPRSQQDR